ncbi:hypothetical protein FHX49_001411 [Microbacterium endophyticum]|uniref:DUF1593 domain-containing protein n=1 Tax=Microbacterium endophyticum TaxID=1526412 RepID=A0A7W4V3H8_9MICO|nr:nucleoside hydrolase-like domain-containing protein [Microbacterium endophyticum]MBB2975844.1 hypothetical protein [Microbacterium endophyticum]NIK36327.1 hypothetical protein [Microbacterium endophyticum]
MNDSTAEASVRPRTIITADPELDDLNSMIRFLLYTNEVEVAGLVYASSQFHWRGDGQGTRFFLPDREYAEPQTSWRWAPGERFIDDAVDAYTAVYENLAVHDPRYPTPAALRAVVREGNVDFEGDTSRETPGSQLIAAVLLDERTDPVHLQMWAGPSTVARALMSIEERFADTAEWSAVHAAVSAKAIITKFASQDATYDDYIAPHWPDIRVVEVATMGWGYMIRRVLPEADASLISADWLRANVTSVGPLGARYRVWGDGRQMVPGDTTDYFHLSGLTADELRAQGYQVWIDPQKAGEWISEGDSTNMLNLIVPGLRGHEHPSYGGWGGYAARTDDGADTWAIADSAFGGRGDERSVMRWFADAQTDFAARLQWSVSGSFEEVNHHPKLHVDRCDIDVSLGERVELRAQASDPDGDAVTVRWWHDAAASTVTGDPVVSAAGEIASVVIPATARPGDTIHIIAEAEDDAPHPLKSYQRVILTVRS